MVFPLQKWFKAMTVLASLFAIGSIITLFNIDEPKRSPLCWVIAAIWAIVPSVWFGLENAQIAASLPVPNPTALDKHKLNQDTAKMVWAGISVLILLLMDGTGPHHTPSDKANVSTSVAPHVVQTTEALTADRAN